MGGHKDERGLLVGGQGSPVWLAVVIEEICEELDQIWYDIGCCRAFQERVDSRASHSRRAVEAHSGVIGVSLVVIYGERVGGNGLVALGPKSVVSHWVAMPTHCEVGPGEFA